MKKLSKKFIVRMGFIVGLQTHLVADTLSLSAGWNLVGANSNMSLEELQNSIGEENLLEIQGRSTSYKKSYIDTGTDFLNDFERFEDGEGYWINVAEDSVVEFVAQEISENVINLSKGWNLINPQTELTLEEIQTQIGEANLIMIQGPEKSYKKENLDNGLEFLNDFEKFEEPKGYWIKVEEEAVILEQVNVVDEFSGIRKLIKDANDGLIEDVQYISVGDSTRAIDDYYNGGELYGAVSSALQQYNVETILQATAGHAYRKWNNYDGQDALNSPTWDETVAEISDDGNSTIVNLSLGINDARYYGDGGEKERIKFHMAEAIDKILAEKPATKIMLTMPHRLVGMDTKTSEIKAAYKEMAEEKNLPLINTIDALFGGEVDLSLYRAADAQEYGESIRIHLSSSGQGLISDLILSQILP